MWTKSLGGSSLDVATSIQQTIDGGYIVAGYTYSNDGDVKGNHGTYDCWIVKLKENGDTIWTKTLGGSNYDEAYSIQQTSDDGYIVAGSTASNNGNVQGNHGNNDYWIVKLNSKGNIKWQKCLGGSDFDDAFSIRQTNDGGYIVAGAASSINGDVHGNHSFGNPDVWIVKLNSMGDTLMPNPVHDMLRIKTQSDAIGKVVVEVINANGKSFIKKQFDMNIGENNFSLPVQSISSGTYFIKIIQGDNIISSARFIKE